MAPLKLSQIIDLIGDSKLNLELGCKEENESAVVTQLLDSLQNPVDFPSLDQAILAEDTVCIALDPLTPSGLLIAAQLAKHVNALGVSHDHISILLAESASSAVVRQLKNELDKIDCSECYIAIHDSNKREDIAFLGPSESGNPILLNAKLVHADFVLPVSSPEASGWKSQIDFLYPYFSDIDSQKRFFKLNEGMRIRVNQEVSRWLGAVFTVAAINCGTTRVFAGEHSSVRKQLHKLTGAGSPSSADQVKAIQLSDDELSADESQQPYPMVIGFMNSRLCLSVEEVANVIEPLTQRCSNNGTLLLVWNDEVEIPRFVDRDRNEPVSFTDEFGREGQQKLYFASGQTLIAELGMPAVTSLKELKKLVDQHDQVLVLADSDRQNVMESECLN